MPHPWILCRWNPRSLALVPFGCQCSSFPFRSLLFGHCLSGAPLQTLLPGEFRKSWSPASAKRSMGSNFSCTLASPWSCYKNNHCCCGFSLLCMMLLEQMTEISIRSRLKSSIVNILNVNNCSVVMDGNALYLESTHRSI